MPLNKKNVIAVLVLTALALLCWLPRLKGPIDLRWDGGAYYVLGTALAQGKGYRLLNEPGEIQTTLHPPMLPMMVALHQLVLGTSDVETIGLWLRRFYLILFVAYIIAAYVMLRVFLPTGYAFLAALVCLFQLHTIFMSDLCFPEIPFGLATVLFTLCNLKPTRRLLRAPLAVVSYALRTIGATLLAAWVVESVCERRFRQAALRLLISLAPVLCWAVYIAYVESGQEYKNPAYEYQRADYTYINVSYARNMRYKDSFSPELGYASLSDKAGGFLSNLVLMPASLGEAVSTREPIWDLLRSEINRQAGYPVLPLWAVRLSFFFLTAFIVGGIGLQLAERQYFISFYILFSLAAICATPWPGQFNRYLSPLAPFLSLSLFLAVRAAAGRLSKLLPVKLHSVSLGLTGAVVLLIFASQAATLLLLYTRWHQRVVFAVRDGHRVEYRLFFYKDLYRATDAGLDWLKGRARGSEVLAATDPQWAYLRTGLKSVLPPFETDASKAQRLLDSVPVTFLIVDDGAYKKYTARVVAAHPDRWRRVYAESSTEADGVQGKFEIYERTGPQ
jgi:hypothetical protein